MANYCESKAPGYLLFSIWPSTYKYRISGAHWRSVLRILPYPQIAPEAINLLSSSDRNVAIVKTMNRICVILLISTVIASVSIVLSKHMAFGQLQHLSDELLIVSLLTSLLSIACSHLLTRTLYKLLNKAFLNLQPTVS